MITIVNNKLEELVNLIRDYEDSIINEDSSRKQMQYYLKIDRFITKNELSHEEELKALEEAGAWSPMSCIHDWYEDLQYRMETK